MEAGLPWTLQSPRDPLSSLYHSARLRWITVVLPHGDAAINNAAVEVAEDLLRNQTFAASSGRTTAVETF